MWLQTIELIITSKLICNVCMYKKNYKYFNDAVEFVGFFPSHWIIDIYQREKQSEMEYENTRVNDLK